MTPDDDEWDYFEPWPGPTDVWRETGLPQLGIIASGVLKGLAVNLTSMGRAMGKLAAISEQVKYNTAKDIEAVVLALQPIPYVCPECFVNQPSEPCDDCKLRNDPRAYSLAQKKNLKKYPGVTPHGRFERRGR